MTQSVKIVLRNPLRKSDTLDYTIKVNDSYIGRLWYDALVDLLRRNNYLEKNFCFLGFPDSARDLEYICSELEWAKNKINTFFDPSDYYIGQKFSPTTMRDGLDPNQALMNVLHNHFEHLQGTVGGLSDWYKRADYETKFAIRQLNNLCHEAESLMLSQRKKAEAPQWIRPSQITTFLNAPRLEFPNTYKQTYAEHRYDRRFGYVYLHWAQIGKTLYEVYIDENGADIDQTTCDAITHLKYYSGEFDIEWARNVTFDGPYPWHTERMKGFKDWLVRNGFDPMDRQYNFGYHEIGQVDILNSFGTTEHEDVWAIMNNHLDIYRIETPEVTATYDYAWADPDYYQQQIERLKAGYDYSSRG
jgi:hypothetical protein